jgi:hypothetical protein
VKERCISGGLDAMFCQELIVEIKKINGAKGIFLAGSAAQDELLWWHTGNKKVLMSDIEVGVVTSDLRVRKSIRSIAAQLSLKYGYEVEIFLVTPRRLKLGSPKNFSFRPHHPNLIMYDIAYGAHWLWRQSEMEVRQFNPAALPPWEGVRLILNRLGEGGPYLMPWFDEGIILNRALLERWVLKLLLALGDALLLVSGKYVAGYGNRKKIWQESGQSFDMGQEFSDTILAAYGARDGGGFSVNYLTPEVLLNRVRSIISILISKHCGLDDNNYNCLIDIDTWCSCFRKNKVPLRFQAPLKAFDGIYDSIHLLPSFYKSSFSFSVLLQAMRRCVPLQVFGYGVIAIGLLNEKYSARGWMDSFFSRHSKVGEAVNIFEQTKAWWSVFCK